MKAEKVFQQDRRKEAEQIKAAGKLKDWEEQKEQQKEDKSRGEVMRYAKFYTDTYKIKNTPWCVQNLPTPSFHTQITLMLPDSPIDMHSISQI